MISQRSYWNPSWGTVVVSATKSDGVASTHLYRIRNHARNRRGEDRVCVAKGGAQSLYGVYADLTTYAKAMGNGYPVACFGGRAEVMDVIGAGGGVVHGGTYTQSRRTQCCTWYIDVLANTNALETVDRVGAEHVLGRVFTAFGIEHRFAGPPRCLGFILGTMYRPIIEIGKSPIVSCMLPSLELIRHGVMLEPDSRALVYL